MNRFILSTDPVEAAVLQCDKHIVKMPLEEAQMLSSAHNELDGGQVAYKTAHKNHPCTVWVRETRSNYLWAVAHWKALGEEYTRRYGKVHKSLKDHWQTLSKPPRAIPDGPLTTFPQCMPDEYKDKCSVQAYWNYYIGEKHVVANLKTEKLYEQRPKETY